MDVSTVSKFWDVVNACTHAGGGGNACPACMTDGLTATLNVVETYLNMTAEPSGYESAREDSAKLKAYGEIQAELQT